jgi:hypothetical protein
LWYGEGRIACLTLEIAKLTPFDEDLDLERESRLPACFSFSISESISMAGKESTSRKRSLHEVANESPARKRVNIEAKSPKTAIRDASEALIEAIKQAEEVHLHPARIVPKAARGKGTKTDTESANFEFERDEPTGLPYIYIVMKKTPRRPHRGTRVRIYS